jgi:hypothetical protein
MFYLCIMMVSVMLFVQVGLDICQVWLGVGIRGLDWVDVGGVG